MAKKSKRTVFHKPLGAGEKKTETQKALNKKRRTVDGITFDSIKEANYYKRLLREQSLGKVQMVLCQVPFHLPGGVKYVCDFLVFRSDGEVEVVDVKGFETPVYRLKKKQVEAAYPVEILER